jgi:uncharacterized membrane protein
MTQQHPRKRRWQTWLLIASLGLNLAVVGLVAGAFLKGPLRRPPAGIGLIQYTRALPAPYRSELHQKLRETRPDWRDTREALRGQRAALADALTAEPFDPAAITGVLGHEAELSDTLAERGTQMLVEQILRMSAAERADYAKALRHSHRRKPSH